MLKSRPIINPEKVSDSIWKISTITFSISIGNFPQILYLYDKCTGPKHDNIKVYTVLTLVYG